MAARPCVGLLRARIRFKMSTPSHLSPRLSRSHSTTPTHQGERSHRRLAPRGVRAINTCMYLRREVNFDGGSQICRLTANRGVETTLRLFIITPGGPLTRPRGHRADPSPSPGPPLSLRQGRQGRRRLGALARRPHAQHVELEDVRLAAEQVAERGRGAPEVAVHKLLDVRPRLGEVGKVGSSTHTRWWGKGRATPHNSTSK